MGGNGGGSGRDEPTDWEPKLSDSKREEEEEEEEDMADQNMESMTFGPLALPAILQNMSKRMERMNTQVQP